jgi:hypothetical protein
MRLASHDPSRAPLPHSGLNTDVASLALGATRVEPWSLGRLERRTHMTLEPYTVEQYLLDDYPRTLFPLTTTSVLVEQFSAELKDYVYNRVLAPASTLPGFPVQQRCYAAKRGHSLRRTVKLDPAAEFFIYDVVFRNRKTLRADHRATRRSFGYRFSAGRPDSVTEAYAGFKAAVAGVRHHEPLTLKADVATYFNSIYHHDLVNSVRGIGWPDSDVEAIGRFLRELNAGRSVDCLPQGIHPCKALGSEFLRFIDNSLKLRSKRGIRFLDDIHFFDSNETTLISDLVVLQELLGERGLSLNDAKTALGKVEEVDVPKQVDVMKQSLLQMRRHTFSVSGEEIEAEVPVPLDASQVEYLLNLLQSPDIEESDAELVLVLLRDHADQVFARMADLLSRYPGLTKAVYHYARLAVERSELDSSVLQFLQNSPNATEYQLFWLGKIVEDFLLQSQHFGSLIAALLDHPNATIISRAKVMEIPDRRFGLPELREEILRSGRSDWEAWASACGARCEPAAGRNHLLTYFAKGSPLNSLIAECVRKIP